MKNRNLYALTFIGIIGMMACEDKLNVEPNLSISDDAALTNEANIKKLMIGTYQIDGTNFSHGGYVQVFTDLMGIGDQVSWNGTYTQPREILDKNILVDNFLISETWKNLYKGINESNLVLAHLDVITDDAERSSVEGEARFIRAFDYFELVRLFGNETLGVPLRTEPVSDFGGDLKIQRSPTADVYDVILDDLAHAATLLPDDNDVFADKYAALALTARVQLYLGHDAEARDAADNVITNSGKTLSPGFAEAFNHDEDGAEDIYMTQVTSQGGDNGFIEFYASEDYGGRGGDISINQSYLDLFDDPNDVRSQFFYENPKGDRLTSKYTNQFGNVPVIRLAEMILIRAESNLRLSTAIGATSLDDVNSIRLRSGASALAAVTINDILLERQRELGFEGFGIYDIKRTHGSVAGLNYNDPKLVFPIPQSEMDTNPLMVQNEGY